MWPHIFMKTFTARSDDTIRRTVVLFPSAPSSRDAILPHMVLSTGLPALVVGLFCAGALAGLLGGTITTLLLFLHPQSRPFDIHEGIFGVGVNIALLVIFSLFTAPQPAAHAESFVAGAASADRAPVPGEGPASRLSAPHAG